jgi:ribonuclease J
VASGRVLVDGKGVGDVGEVVIRDRRHMSSEGVVIVLIVADNQTGEIISGPELLSRGFVFEDEREDLLAEAKELVVQALAELEEPDWTEAQERIRRTLRRFFRRSLDRYPMIMSMILPM